MLTTVPVSSVSLTGLPQPELDASVKRVTSVSLVMRGRPCRTARDDHHATSDRTKVGTWIRSDQGRGAVSDLSLISDLGQKFKHDLWRVKSELKLSQKQPVFANETGSVLSTKWLPFIQTALLAAKMVVIPTTEMRTARKLSLGFSWRRPVTWSLRHLSTQVRLDKEVNTRLHTLPTCPNFHLRPNDELHSHNYLLSSCSINAWEGHLYSEWLDSRPFTSEAKIEVNDGRMWCSAQLRLRMDVQGDSISLCEISPGIGWRANHTQPLLRRS